MPHVHPGGPVEYEYKAFVIDSERDDEVKFEIDLGFGFFSVEKMLISDGPFNRDLIGRWVTIRCHKDRPNRRYYCDIWMNAVQYHEGKVPVEDD
tara:strand:- start:233 stop:514 length:282 start_codon:yes stop_codon:yes gene_type:complete